MAIIYDTIETEPYSAYSGSYVDQFIVGSPVGNVSTHLSATIYTAQRMVIGTKHNRQFLTDSLNTIAKWQYSTYSALLYCSQIGAPNRFGSFFDNDKTYLDSIMPDMVSIALANGEYVWGANYSTYSDPDLQIPAFTASKGAEILIKRFSPWPQRFPFETTYKNFPKLIQQGRKLAFATGSLENLAFVSFEDSSLDRFTIIDVSSSNPTVDFADSAIGPIFEDVGTFNRALLLPIESYRNIFFGIGDGLKPKTIELSTLAGSRWRHLPTFRIRYFPDPDFLATPMYRGFKYGVWSANPVKLKTVFRNNRYGNVRDMLEQPLLGASLDDGAYNYYVTAKFSDETAVTASLYATASSETSFNPRDSGQWDFAYRCGQPFFDV